MGTSGNIIDPDLIPENIKNAVEIFGVVGTLVDGLGGMTQILKWIPYGTMTAINNNATDRPSSAYYACVNTALYVYVIYILVGNPYGWPCNLYPTAYRLTKATGVFTRLTGTTIASMTGTPIIDSVYTDGSIILINSRAWSGGGQWRYRVHQYTIATDTWAGLHEDPVNRFDPPPVYYPMTLATLITNGIINDVTKKFTFSGETFINPFPNGRVRAPVITIDNI